MEKFNSRETYLVARANWKAEYAQLSSDIRAQRATYKLSQQEWAKVDVPWAVYKALPPEPKKEHSARCRAMNDNVYRLTNLRNKANQMLDDLAEAKIEAGKQMMQKAEPVTL